MITSLSDLIYLQTTMALILGRIITKGKADNRSRIDSDNIKKILVIKTDEIGDFVLVTPFLRELRIMFPRAFITLVVNPAIYPLAELCPHVNEIMVYHQESPYFLKPLILPGRAFKIGYGSLRHRKFDLALLPRWDMNTDYSAYLSYFSFSERRIGVTEHINARKKLVNKGFDLLFTDVISDDLPGHEVERNLNFIRYLGGKPLSDTPELWLTQEDEDFAENMLAGFHPKMLIAFCPGAGKMYRQWPKKRFVELGKSLRDIYDTSFIVIGGIHDRPLGRYIQHELRQRIKDLTGRTTLRQTAALLKRCHLYVGNDTGAMHLAAAAGTPVVEISCFPVCGPASHWNSPRRFGPWRVPHRILQPQKDLSGIPFASVVRHLDCIHEISVRQVEDAVRELVPNIKGGA